MDQNFQADHLPIVGEFVMISVVYLLGKTLQSNNEVDELINNIKDRCISQGIDEATTIDVLQRLNDGIKFIKDSK